MGSWRKAAGPRLMKAKDIGVKPVRCTITEVGTHTLRSKNGSAEEKVYIAVDKFPKALGLNKTNGDELAKLFGDDFDNWPGQKIELYLEDTQFNGDACKGIRIRGVK